jgi:hypothetical protein
MKRIVLAAVATLLLSMSFVVSPVKALPANEVDNSYYDANWNLVGEHDIYCDGSHFEWGLNSGTAHRSTDTLSCSSSGSTANCYYWDSACGCYVLDYMSHCGV